MRLRYFILLIVIIAVEVVIALTQHDNLLRDYGGDVIVVWAVYCLVQTVLGGKNNRYIVHLGVFLFAVAVELLQAVNIVDRIGLGDIRFFRVLIGTSFSPWDLVSYGIGTMMGCLGTLIYNKVKCDNQ